MKNISTIARPAVCLVAIGCMISACSSSPKTDKAQPVANHQTSAVKPGGIYVYKGGDGSLGALKVLAIDDGTVDVLLYKNRFQTVPESIDLTALEVNVKHEILSARGFQNWQPQMVAEQAVTKEELTEPPQ